MHSSFQCRDVNSLCKPDAIYVGLLELLLAGVYIIPITKIDVRAINLVYFVNMVKASVRYWCVKCKNMYF